MLIRTHYIAINRIPSLLTVNNLLYCDRLTVRAIHGIWNFKVDIVKHVCPVIYIFWCCTRIFDTKSQDNQDNRYNLYYWPLSKPRKVHSTWHILIEFRSQSRTNLGSCCTTAGKGPAASTFQAAMPVQHVRSELPIHASVVQIIFVKSCNLFFSLILSLHESTGVMIGISWGCDHVTYQPIRRVCSSPQGLRTAHTVRLAHPSIPLWQTKTIYPSGYSREIFF